MKHADQAIYEAKRCGKNRTMWFDLAYEKRLEAQRRTLRELDKAVNAGQLTLYYRPIIDCRSGAPSGGRADGLDLRISVNVFVRQLQETDFISRLAKRIGRYASDNRGMLEIDIVEHAAIEEIADIGTLLADCKALGLTSALDDFGTDYSSLDHVLRIPADVMKLDRSFVRDILTNAENRVPVDAVIGIAGSFGHTVVAEGVEDPAQVQALRDAGCDVMQGFYFAEPIARRISSNG